ncbi:MAG: hypothetical protein IJF27_07110 [Oscillospiraceae bacterium]|nr:hypothetical protein [Oscillospiraceae bacterium]
MKRMTDGSLKKVIAVLAAALMLMTSCVTAFAESETTEVTVTVVGENGEIVLAAEKIAVTDSDSDGVITINDALYCAHEAKYPGGAAAGYGFENTDYGLSLTLLWGIDNGGSYGYMLNDGNPMSMADPVKNGDYVCAYAYTDLTAWSDVYSYFDVKSVEAEAGEEMTLTLRYVGFDENWSPVVIDVAGATVTVDGVATDIVTDEKGAATLTLEKGDHIISAVSEELTLVSPVCVASVAGAGLSPVWCVVIAAAVVAVAAVVIVLVKKKK